MFDLGFSELLIVAIVALVVLGPERLPKATRFAGLWVRRARNQWESVKDELERDLASEELKRTMKEAREVLRDTGQSVRAEADEAREEFEQMRSAVASAAQTDVAVPEVPEEKAGSLEAGTVAPSSPIDGGKHPIGEPGPEPAPAGQGVQTRVTGNRRPPDPETDRGTDPATDTDFAAEPRADDDSRKS